MFDFCSISFKDLKWNLGRYYLFFTFEMWFYYTVYETDKNSSMHEIKFEIPVIIFKDTLMS